MSRPIELRDVGDLRRLAQQLKEFNAPQLKVARIDLWECRVGKLALDLLNILFDPRCCGKRFFVLQVRERRLVLLIRKVDADPAGNEHRACDQRDDENKVFAEKSPGTGLGLNCS